jgi:hypothetical protein
LPPGIYDLRVEKEGFNTIIQQGIVLQVTQESPKTRHFLYANRVERVSPVHETKR